MGGKCRIFDACWLPNFWGSDIYWVPNWKSDTYSVPDCVSLTTSECQILDKLIPASIFFLLLSLYNGRKWFFQLLSIDQRVISYDLRPIFICDRVPLRVGNFVFTNKNSPTLVRKGSKTTITLLHISFHKFFFDTLTTIIYFLSKVLLSFSITHKFLIVYVYKIA